MERLFSCMRHVESYDKDEPDRRDVSPDRLLQIGPLGLAAGEYTFAYDYPLSKVATYIHAITAETTAQELLQFAADDYKRIYEEEDSVCGPTGNIPGMLNRDRSQGPHGIWGHSIGDLWFEYVSIDRETKRIEFGIGS